MVPEVKTEVQMNVTFFISNPTHASGRSEARKKGQSSRSPQMPQLAMVGAECEMRHKDM